VEAEGGQACHCHSPRCNTKVNARQDGGIADTKRRFFRGTL
jgi:hypothetical protein